MSKLIDINMKINKKTLIKILEEIHERAIGRMTYEEAYKDYKSSLNTLISVLRNSD